MASNLKFQVRQLEEYVNIDDDDDDMDEYGEMMPPSKTPKMSSTGGASSTARNVKKGPINLYFPQKSQQKGGFEKGAGVDETKKILRECVGQHGPRMKPPTFYEMNSDITIQDLLVADLPRYKMADGLFGCGQSKRAKDTRSPGKHLVYIKYNRTLKRCYDARDNIDPILLDNIDDSNEWLVGFPKDKEDELVYEEGDLTWGSVCYANWS
ncbi:hypothetical protein KY284_010745 [Solanum tuberosum]|nr:hypothetical protein KY284_010745 [Solanum tuberosum]